MVYAQCLASELPRPAARHRRYHRANAKTLRTRSHHCKTDPGVEKVEIRKTFGTDCDRVRNEQSIPAGVLGFFSEIADRANVQPVNYESILHVFLPLQCSRSAGVCRRSRRSEARLGSGSACKRGAAH